MKLQKARRVQSLVVMSMACLALDSGVTLHAQQGGGALQAQVLTRARFALIVGGVEIASFTRFDSTVDPASASARIITLSGGQTYSPEMAAWHELVMVGDIAGARRNCTLVMYDASGSPVSTYNFTHAWPKKYTGVGLKQHLTEAVMLEYESAEVRAHE
jgi:hypothetical protein